ncbi:MAG TPA: sulfatase-like hydrolase/transferase [Streptosporangiales bacterium]
MTTGCREDTLLVVTADHGDYVGEYGLVRKGAELPEVLTRVPLVVDGPGVAGGRGPSPPHVSLAGVLPTVCTAVGAEPPPGVQAGTCGDCSPERTCPASTVRTRNRASADARTRRRTVPEPLPGLGVPGGSYDFDGLNAVTQGGARRMVRTGDWKIVLDESVAGRLYDLRDDPFELRDLWHAPEHLAVRCELSAELARWTTTAEDPLPIPREGYPRLSRS